MQQTLDLRSLPTRAVARTELGTELRALAAASSKLRVTIQRQVASIFKRVAPLLRHGRADTRVQQVVHGAPQGQANQSGRACTQARVSEGR